MAERDGRFGVAHSTYSPPLSGQKTVCNLARERLVRVFTVLKLILPCTRSAFQDDSMVFN
jgi:hypothetical protein